MSSLQRLFRLLACVLVLSALGCAHVHDTPADATPQASVEQLLAVAQRAEQVGDTLRAQQYLLSALAGGADERRVLPWLLRLYVQDGQYRSAIERARERLRVRSDDIPLRLLLATLYRATDLETSAVEQYELVLQQAPEQARAHLELAMLLQDTGHDAARADQHFRTFLRLAPAAPEAPGVRTRLLKEVP